MSQRFHGSMRGRPPKMRKSRHERPKRVRLPWLEIDPGQEAIDTTLAGLPYWVSIANTMILTVDPGSVASLQSVKEGFPQMAYIPGIKTSPVLVPLGFDSVAGWTSLAETVSTARGYTGSQYVLFENESAIASYIAGEYELNWDQLKAALSQLPGDMIAIWYPSVAYDTEEQFQRYIALAECVEEVLHPVFIDHAKLNRPSLVDTPGTQREVQALLAIASKETIPEIVCGVAPYWPYEQVRGATAKAGTAKVALYPGIERWVEAGKVLSGLLRNT